MSQFQWARLADSHLFVTGGSAVLNGKFHIFGGRTGEGFTVNEIIDTHRSFDPTTNMWSDETPLIYPVANFASCVCNGKIYAIGGENTFQGLTNYVQCYDPATKNWALKANLPYATTKVQACVWNNKIYTFGGQIDENYPTEAYCNYVRCYDPATNTWNDALAPMLNNRREYDIAVIDDIAYFIGGGVGNSSTSTVIRAIYTYNFTQNAWQSSNIGTLPEWREKLQVVAVNRKIHILSGDYFEQTSTTMQLVFNVDTLTWETPYPNLLTERYDFCAELIDNKIFVAGGKSFDKGELTPVAEVFDLIGDYIVPDPQDPPSDPILGTWYNKTRGIVPVSGAGSAIVNGRLYLVGGHDFGSPSSNHMSYSLIDDVWRNETQLSVARYDLSCCELNGKLYAIGGHNGSGTYYALNECYDPVAKTWTAKAPLSIGREDLRVCTWNGKIYAVGGANGTYRNIIECYDPSTNTWTTLAPMPEAKNSFGMTVYKGRIYCMGGLNSTGTLKSCHVYDIPTNTWRSLPDLNYIRRQLALVVLYGKIHVLGGYEDTATNINDISFNYNQIFNPRTELWETAKAPMITGRDRFGVGVVNNKIVVACGWSNGWYTDKTEVYYLDPPANLDESWEWDYTPPPPPPPALVPLGDFVYPSSNPYAKENIEIVRAKVNEFRIANGLTAKVWTDVSIIKRQTPIKAIHWVEIQEAINEVYSNKQSTITDEPTRTVINTTILPKDKRFIVKDLKNRINSIKRALNNN